MKLELLTTTGRSEIQGVSDTIRPISAHMSRSKVAATRQMKQMVAAREVMNYLISTDGRAHNGPAARLLSAASTWAFSDLKTFAAVMGSFGLSGEFVAIEVENEPSFIDTAAYLFLSGEQEDKLGRLAILTFRGTNPSNTINWLTDSNNAMEALGEVGRAHGGFLRGGVVLLPVLKALLLSVSEGKSLKQALRDLQMGSLIPDEAFPEAMQRKDEFFAEVEEEQAAKGRGQLGGGQPEQKPLALYITGHGLGGAFAALMGAAIHLDPELATLQMNPLQGVGTSPQQVGIQSGLRSVYTFGQPMFADRNLALVLEDKFGQRMFRHVYRNDIVPMLPPRITGNFWHFGREYIDMAGVWVRNQNPIRRLYSAALSNIVGSVAWAMDRLPLRQWIPLMFAWGDHSPLNYLRVSHGHLGGFDMLGDRPGGDTPGVC